MSDDKQRFMRSLKAARGEASQREFAIRIGVTQQSIGKWERGESIPTGVGVRDALAKAGVALPQNHLVKL